MALGEKASRKPKAAFHSVEGVPIGRIFLALHNPRHEPAETEQQAIERLCAKEQVLPLARDIVSNGINPLERIALTEIPQSGGIPSYYVEEGNRRICALKLLTDPALAPSKLRSSFEKLADGWQPISRLDAVVFSANDTLKTWLGRTHSGLQGGAGRKVWNADQTQRFFGGQKNRIAQIVLDYAEEQGMITKEERANKLTTAQRFLNPDTFREALGIDRSDPTELKRNRPKADFDIMLKRFMRDLVAGEVVTSRKNKPEISQYANELTSLPGVTTKRIDPEPLTAGEGTPPRKRGPRRKPKSPQRAKRIQFEDDIHRALANLNNFKLASLYHSICTVELEFNTPLVSIGCWAFFETLTNCQGRTENVSFDSFLSKQKLTNLGASDPKPLRQALERVAAFGNTSKHHSVAAQFNGDQLNNDMITLKSVILACIADVPA